jgi:hypothetical protein
MIKGAVNLASYQSPAKAEKVAMTLSMLKILGHELCLSNWSAHVKLVLWSACTLAFFGSFRLGEILCQARNKFTKDNLTWRDVTFNESGSVTIHIRHPKSNKEGGERVEVYSFAGHSCCPVAALRKLHEARPTTDESLPVFAFSHTEFLNRRFFTDMLKQKLEKHIPGHAARGHSFRAGIPSALSARPDLVSTEEIQLWGRWTSDSSKRYSLHTHLARKRTFDKFVETLSLERAGIGI